MWLQGLQKPAFCLVTPALETWAAGSWLQLHLSKTLRARWLDQFVQWIAEQQFRHSAWFVPEQSLPEQAQELAGLAAEQSPARLPWADFRQHVCEDAGEIGKIETAAGEREAVSPSAVTALRVIKVVPDIG